MLAYAQELQSCIDAGSSSNMSHCQIPPAPPPDPSKRRSAVIWLLDALADLDPLRSDWPVLLRRRAAQLSSLSQDEYLSLSSERGRSDPRWQRELANLASYLVFRHWHKAVNDDALYGRAAFICVSCAALSHLALFQPEGKASLWSRFSREIEHSEENLDALILLLSSRSIRSLADMF